MDDSFDDLDVNLSVAACINEYLNNWGTKPAFDEQYRTPLPAHHPHIVNGQAQQPLPMIHASSDARHCIHHHRLLPFTPLLELLPDQTRFASSSDQHAPTMLSMMRQYTANLSNHEASSADFQATSVRYWTTHIRHYRPNTQVTVDSFRIDVLNEEYDRYDCGLRMFGRHANALEPVLNMLHELHPYRNNVMSLFAWYVFVVALQFWCIARGRFMRIDDRADDFLFEYPEHIMLLMPRLDFRQIDSDRESSIITDSNEAAQSMSFVKFARCIAHTVIQSMQTTNPELHAVYIQEFSKFSRNNLGRSYDSTLVSIGFLDLHLPELIARVDETNRQSGATGQAKCSWKYKQVTRTGAIQARRRVIHWPTASSSMDWYRHLPMFLTHLWMTPTHALFRFDDLAPYTYGPDLAANLSIQRRVNAFVWQVAPFVTDQLLSYLQRATTEHFVSKNPRNWHCSSRFDAMPPSHLSTPQSTYVCFDNIRRLPACRLMYAWYLQADKTRRVRGYWFVEHRVGVHAYLTHVKRSIRHKNVPIDSAWYRCPPALLGVEGLTRSAWNWMNSHGTVCDLNQLLERSKFDQDVHPIRRARLLELKQTDQLNVPDSYHLYQLLEQMCQSQQDAVATTCSLYSDEMTPDELYDTIIDQVEYESLCKSTKLCALLHANAYLASIWAFGNTEYTELWTTTDVSGAVRIKLFDRFLARALTEREFDERTWDACHAVFAEVMKIWINPSYTIKGIPSDRTFRCTLNNRCNVHTVDELVRFAVESITRTLFGELIDLWPYAFPAGPYTLDHTRTRANDVDAEPPEYDGPFPLLHQLQVALSQQLASPALLEELHTAPAIPSELTRIAQTLAFFTQRDAQFASLHAQLHRLTTSNALGRANMTMSAICTNDAMMMMMLD